MFESDFEHRTIDDPVTGETDVLVPRLISVVQSKIVDGREDHDIVDVPIAALLPKSSLSNLSIKTLEIEFEAKIGSFGGASADSGRAATSAAPTPMARDGGAALRDFIYMFQEKCQKPEGTGFYTTHLGSEEPGPPPYPGHAASVSSVGIVPRRTGHRVLTIEDVSESETNAPYGSEPQPPPKPAHRPPRHAPRRAPGTSSDDDDDEDSSDDLPARKR